MLLRKPGLQTLDINEAMLIKLFSWPAPNNLKKKVENSLEKMFMFI